MKKLLFIPALLAVVLVLAQVQGSAPGAVRAAFAKTYPGATKVKYEKENGNYEVSFQQNGSGMSATYDAIGGLLETEETITASKLPPAVMPYFSARYKGEAVKETARIINNKGVTTYEIGIRGRDILFDANGKFLKETKE